MYFFKLQTYFSHPIIEYSPYFSFVYQIYYVIQLDYLELIAN